MSILEFNAQHLPSSSSEAYLSLGLHVFNCLESIVEGLGVTYLLRGYIPSSTQQFLVFLGASVITSFRNYFSIRGIVACAFPAQKRGLRETKAYTTISSESSAHLY